MNNFYKSLSNKIINSPYISRWSVIVIDTLVATFATMYVYLVLGFFTNTIPVFSRYAFIGASTLVTTMATFLLFGTYRGIMRHTTIQEIIRLGFAVMFKSVILFILFISLRKVAGFTFKPINIFFAQVADPSGLASRGSSLKLKADVEAGKVTALAAPPSTIPE